MFKKLTVFLVLALLVLSQNLVSDSSHLIGGYEPVSNQDGAN